MVSSRAGDLVHFIKDPGWGPKIEKRSRMVVFKFLKG
jgi:hypothetical protein